MQVHVRRITHYMYLLVRQLHKDLFVKERCVVEFERQLKFVLYVAISYTYVYILLLCHHGGHLVVTSCLT